MPDTRLPDTVIGDPRYDALNDAAFRVWCLGYVWSNKHGTDGHIPEIALRYLHPDGIRRDVVDDLVCHDELWEVDQERGGYTIVGFLDTQTSAAKIRKQREDNVRRQQEWRDRQVARDASPPESPNALPNTSPLRKGQDKDRQGSEDLPDQDRETEPSADLTDEQRHALVFGRGVA